MRVHFPKIIYEISDPVEHAEKLALGYTYIPEILRHTASWQIFVNNPLYHGYGLYDGKITKQDIPLTKPVEVQIFHKPNGVRVYKILSNADGSFHIRNIAKGQPFLLVVNDPDNIYRTVVQDITL